MTPHKQAIIESAVNAAVAFGTGICSSVVRELTDAGYYYNTEAEDYAIEYWASLRRRGDDHEKHVTHWMKLPEEPK